MPRFTVAAVAVGWVATAALAAAPSPVQTLTAAKQVLDDLTEKNRAIPAKLLHDAEAVVVIPNTIKAGLGVGGQVGHGVAIIKDKAGGWGDIRFITLGGASVGFQIGVQSTDVVLVFKNRKGLDRILDGKAKLKLGADASVAAGPVGRDAAVATDLLLKSEIFSYSRSKGLFAGVSLNGVVLAANTKRTEEYEKDSGPRTLAAGNELKKTIAVLATVPMSNKVPLPAPGLVPVPQPLPPAVPKVMPPGPPGLGLPPALEPPLPVPPPSVPSSPAFPTGKSTELPDPAVVPASATEPAEPQVGPIRRFLRRVFR